MKYKINDKVVDVRILKPTDSIRELNIKDPFETARIASLLESKGIKTIGQLCSYERNQLLQIDKLGELSLERISHELSTFGYHFGMTKEKLMEIHEKEGLVNHDDVLCALKDKIHEILMASSIEQPTDAEENEQEEEDSPSALDCIDWEERFYNLAKEEYLRLGGQVIGDLRIDYSIAAAKDFIFRMRNLYEKKLIEA